VGQVVGQGAGLGRGEDGGLAGWYP
jgi:hypothetical protein